jgi:hypothetical protein
MDTYILVSETSSIADSFCPTMYSGEIDHWLDKRKLPKKNRPGAVPLEEQIRQRAFEIYLQRGGQDGSDLDDWQQAEAEIRSGKE